MRALDLPRSEQAAEAAQLRSEGLLQREIAARMLLSRSYVAELLSDPHGEKVKARKRSYQGVCEDCGKPTDGSNGARHAPKKCNACYITAHTPEHGTRSRYQAGCGCDACREAQRLDKQVQREKNRGKPPTHGHSGYINYGCRCDVCREAHRKWEWLHPEYRLRWQAKRRGTEPPRHGYSTAYNVYQCRCDECKAWNRAKTRKRRQSVRSAA